MGEKLSDMAKMDDAIAFSDDGRGVQSDEMMRAAMTEAKRLGKTIVAHCEVNSLLKGGYIHDGVYAKEHGHRGICSESDKGYIYVWVDEIPEGTFIDLAEMKGTAYFGPNTHDEWINGVYTNKRDVPLTTGLNIVPSALKDGVLYIRYVCDTDTAPTGKKLADYPNVPIHIEGGYVNGYFFL